MMTWNGMLSPEKGKLRSGNKDKDQMNQSFVIHKVQNQIQRRISKR